MKDLLDLLRTLESEDHVELYDHFDFEFDEDLLIESNVVGMAEDGVVINGDDVLIGLLEGKGFVCIPADNSGIKCSPSDDDINSIATESLEAYETKSVSSMGISRQSYEQLAKLLAKAMPDSKNAKNLAREILGLDQNEIDESGLQAYLGKKKYGEKGMQALQKAGREGASKEKMAKIRAQHDKLDEVQVDEARGYKIEPKESPVFKGSRANPMMRHFSVSVGNKEVGWLEHDKDDDTVRGSLHGKSVNISRHKGDTVADKFKSYINQMKEEVEQVDEAKYQGREVPLGKPMQGDVKK